MKYTTEIIIKLSLSEFIKKLNSPENMKHWQEGLIDYEHISGTPGQIGSKMRLNYKLGNRSMELVETILHTKLPNELHLTYDAKGMHNVQENYFEETPDGFTKWTSKIEFIPTTFMLRMATLVIPNAFKKQTKKYMQNFKNFAENGISVANA
ncbi:SRPBCC family protein [Corallibacter sp.]|uniref:SRPBCC family protein n=1 Tax=Corallibacter sp. TaxID=2038084 RepID=UPI003A8D224D